RSNHLFCTTLVEIDKMSQEIKSLTANHTYFIESSNTELECVCWILKSAIDLVLERMTEFSLQGKA
ncbi:MAG: hypothetical protein AAB870_01365, partial [Patescibacteria group bacterium]